MSSKEGHIFCRQENMQAGKALLSHTGIKENADVCQKPVRPIQTKLTAGAPGDVYEKAADAMADKVMRMPEQKFVQRKCAACEEEEKKAQRKPLSESVTPFIQTKTENSAPVVSDSLSHSIESAKGSGSAMDSSVNSFMSNRFGVNFSDVKIHTDGEAIQMNRELNAKAFTTGNDIYFNEGQYQPHSDSGKHLLAHELAHTIQQNKSNSVYRKPLPDANCKKPFHTCRIEEGIAVGTQYVDAAIAAITPVAGGTVTTGAVVDLLLKHFKQGAVEDASKILENFGLIKKELTADIVYHCYDENPPDCKSDKGVTGAYTECTASSDVHICVFYNVAGCEERGRMITHELTHHLGFCRDYAYADEEKYKTLPHADAMRNADCYAQFAKEIFSGKPACKC